LIEKLQDLLKEEKENAEGFMRLPRRFIEMSKVLLDMYVTLPLVLVFFEFSLIVAHCVALSERN